jgi:hypothetical protein
MSETASPPDSPLITIDEVAALLGVTPDAARKQLSRWAIGGTTYYPAAAVRTAHAARKGRGNWAPASLNEGRYDLHENDGLHWWTCKGCSKQSGVYATKRGARNSAERHADKCTVDPA